MSCSHMALLFEDSPEVVAEVPVQSEPVDWPVNDSVCLLGIPDDRDEEKGLQSTLSSLSLTVCHILDQFHTAWNR